MSQFCAPMVSGGFTRNRNNFFLLMPSVYLYVRRARPFLYVLIYFRCMSHLVTFITKTTTTRDRSTRPMFPISNGATEWGLRGPYLYAGELPVFIGVVRLCLMCMICRVGLMNLMSSSPAPSFIQSPGCFYNKV